MQFDYIDHGLDNGKWRQAMIMFIKFFVMLVATHMVLGTLSACTSLQTINAITP